MEDKKLTRHRYFKLSISLAVHLNEIHSRIISRKLGFDFDLDCISQSILEKALYNLKTKETKKKLFAIS